MQTVNIRDARRCLSKLVDAAANSDEITVTKTGKPVGTIHDQRMIATTRAYALQPVCSPEGSVTRRPCKSVAERAIYLLLGQFSTR